MDLLTNNKTCPEESIYQIGTVDEFVSGETLAKIAAKKVLEELGIPLPNPNKKGRGYLKKQKETVRESASF